MSDYTDPETQEALHEHDLLDYSLKDRETGKAKRIWCLIFNPFNLGAHMSIDEKNIGGECYTIIANKETGKIFLMIMTTKAKLICQVLSKLPLKVRLGVKTISKDLASNFDWVARTMFPHALRVADKFHVLVLGFEALQDVRVRFRQAVLTKEREEKERQKKEDEKIEKEGKKKKTKPKISLVKFSNGDTEKELLARSRYLLFKKEKDWTESQEQRARILFDQFPEIQSAYQLINNFRLFYEKETIEDAKNVLEQWYLISEFLNIPEVLNFVDTVKSHETQILNYFKTKQTNAFAESLNAKIQRFVNSCFGFRDRLFFHFRLRKHFS